MEKEITVLSNSVIKTDISDQNYWEEKAKIAAEALANFRKNFKRGCITCSPDFRRLSRNLYEAQRQCGRFKNESSKSLQS